MGVEVDNEMPEHDTEYEVIIKQTVISKQLQGRGGVKSHGWVEYIGKTTTQLPLQLKGEGGNLRSRNEFCIIWVIFSFYKQFKKWFCYFVCLLACLIFLLLAKQNLTYLT